MCQADLDLTDAFDAADSELTEEDAESSRQLDKWFDCLCDSIPNSAVMRFETALDLALNV